MGIRWDLASTRMPIVFVPPVGLVETTGENRLNKIRKKQGHYEKTHFPNSDKKRSWESPGMATPAVFRRRVG